MQIPLPEAKPAQIILYHNDCRGGNTFNLDKAQEDYEELVDAGWVDTPADLEAFEELEVEITAEEVEAMSPDQIVKKVKAMGFHVLNDVELAAAKSGEPEPLTDEQLVEMLESRNITYKPSKEELIEFAGEYGLKVSEDALINRYIQSPTSLTKEELVVLGADYELKLKMTMNEATMIGNINEAIENSKGK